MNPSGASPNAEASSSRVHSPFRAIGTFISSVLPNFGVSSGSAPIDPDTLPVAVRLLTFFQDGFTIGTIPQNIQPHTISIDEIPDTETNVAFYRYSEPQNQALLQQILDGRAPLSTFQVQYGQRVELRILERKSHTYTSKSTSKQLPYSGQGFRVGA